MPVAPSTEPPTSKPELPPLECALTSPRIAKDTTLYKACSPYIVKSGGIDVVDNAVLTIEAGVEMRFRDGDWLEISAAFTRGAGIIAKGTKAEPIVLTSVEPDNVKNGTWLGLWLNEGTASGSVVQHVIIRSAGGNNKHIKPTLVQGCLTLTDVAMNAVTVEDVTAEDCVNAGVVLRRTSPPFRGMLVRRSSVGVLLDGVEPGAVREGFEFAEVDEPVVERPSSLK